MATATKDQVFSQTPSTGDSSLPPVADYATLLASTDAQYTGADAGVGVWCQAENVKAVKVDTGETPPWEVNDQVATATATPTTPYRKIRIPGGATYTRFAYDPGIPLLTYEQDAGAQGPQGPAGTDGTDGATIIFLTAIPAAGDGNDGDLAKATITPTDVRLYGPKAAGAWPGTYDQLVGPSGAGSGDMLKAENLAGLADVPASRGNMGITAAGDALVTAANLAAQKTTLGIAAIEALLASDDTTLDTLQEVVDFVSTNRADLDALGIPGITGLQAALDGKLDDANNEILTDHIADRNVTAVKQPQVAAKTIRANLGAGVADVGDVTLIALKNELLAPQAVTFGANIDIDMSLLATSFEVANATASFVLDNPTSGPVNGTSFVVSGQIDPGNGGAIAITFGGNWRISGTPPTAAGVRYLISGTFIGGLYQGSIVELSA